MRLFGVASWTLGSIVWILFLALGACAGSEVLGTEWSRRPAEVSFASIASGATSGITIGRKALVRDSEDWAALWAEHIRGVSGPLPPPQVDFSQEAVIAIFLGTRPTGGFSVTIRRVERERDGLMVYFREVRPAKGVLVSQVLTQPFHIVLVKTGGVALGRVVFVQE
jgi:hypothetical protein